MSYFFVVMGVVLMLYSSCGKKNDDNTIGTVKDIDGNIYHTVTIGPQVWIVENLKTTRYRNGNAIPNISDNGQWSSLSTGALCNYGNDATIANKYGKLYNWYAVKDSRNIAPVGWHVPTEIDKANLITFLGGENIAGGKMKSTGTIEAGTGLWYSSDKWATNESGFTGFPGGLRSSDGTFGKIGKYGGWWHSSETGSGLSWYMSYDDNFVSKNYSGDKNAGFSVRCLRD